MSSRGKEIVKSNPYNHILPPRDLADIRDYFHIKNQTGEFKGYEACTDQLSRVMENVINGEYKHPNKFVSLPLGTDNGYYISKIYNDMPRGTRALMELTYSMTDAQVVGSLESMNRDKIFLFGSYYGNPLEFVETFRRIEGMLEMRWGIRLAEPQEVHDKVHDTRRATRGEIIQLVDDTSYSLRWLEEDPGAALAYLAKSKKAA